MVKIAGTSMLSSKKAYFDIKIKSGGSTPTDKFNEVARKGPAELFRCSDGSYLLRCYM